MMKKILLGSGLLVLLTLLWIYSRNLDVSADSMEKVDLSIGVDTDIMIPEESTTTRSKEIVEITTSAGVSDNDISESTADTEDAEAENEALYVIETEQGNNLGMVPVAGGQAVVLTDSADSTVHQGEYDAQEEAKQRYEALSEEASGEEEHVIDSWAFYQDSGLKSYVIPEGVTEIGRFAFARSGLESIVIPESVTKIGYGAFYHCDNLKEVVLPDSVETIEDRAFECTPWGAEQGNTE